jgi:hypothetical protein
MITHLGGEAADEKAMNKLGEKIAHLTLTAVHPPEWDHVSSPVLFQTSFLFTSQQASMGTQA